MGFLTLGGFAVGAVFQGMFNIAMEMANTEALYMDCHKMHESVYQELQSTVHYTNRSGVRATCSDCHIPHAWMNKITRKIQAPKGVWGKIFGTIDTRGKFEAHWFELAQHEQGRLKANDSLECHSCRNYESMDFTRQSPRASVIHTQYLGSKRRTCVGCHKDVAHHLPDMSKMETEQSM